MGFTLKTKVVEPKTGRVLSHNPYICFQEGDIQIFGQGGRFYYIDGREIAPKDLPLWAKDRYNAMPDERKEAYGFKKALRRKREAEPPPEYVTVEIPE